MSLIKYNTNENKHNCPFYQEIHTRHKTGYVLYKVSRRMYNNVCTCLCMGCQSGQKTKYCQMTKILKSRMCFLSIFDICTCFVSLNCTHLVSSCAHNIVSQQSPVSCSSFMFGYSIVHPLPN